MSSRTQLVLALAVGAVIPTLGLADVPSALSPKRGIGDAGAYYNELQAVDAGWYYTWGIDPANTGGYNANFYPMVRSWMDWDQSHLSYYTNRGLSYNPNYMLVFNEPERSDQDNMSVSRAITDWSTISSSTISYNSTNHTNIKLVSPSVADTGDGWNWLSSFMSQANTNHLKVDAVAFHWYDVSTPDDPAGAANQFLSRVDSYHNAYGLPVFITEFAIHDWGGTYPVDQMVDANRQFLSIVIPGLESRSYVAGYSWYNWFADSGLYNTTTYEPNVIAYDYIGAIRNGSTSNLGGTNLGEHVAYINGGEVTMTGSAGTVKYLEALYDPNVSTNTSTISGNVDWSVANWTKIQSGATLKKTGSNTISLTGSVTNNGTLEVAQGTLRIGASVGGGGTICISGADSTTHLELTGNITVGQPITSNATSARDVYLQGDNTAGVVTGAISNNASNAGGTINVHKDGTGTWTLSGANTYTGTTSVNSGKLVFDGASSNIGAVNVANSAALGVKAFGNASTTLTSTSLTLSGSNSLSLDFNGLDRTAPLISTGAFTANGAVNVSIQNGGALLPGSSHPIIGYTSFGGTGTFTNSTFTLGPRTTGTLVNNGVNALAINVVGDRPVWTGGDNGNWVTGGTGGNRNWKLQTAGTATDYRNDLGGDNVLFDDSATGSTAISINSANVSPAGMTFNNSSKNYSITSTGGYGIAGTGSLVKNGNGSLTMSTANSFTGNVIVNGGTFYAANGVNVANRTSGSFGDPSVAGKTVTISNGGTVVFTQGNILGTGSMTTAPALSFVVNQGGVLRTAASDVGGPGGGDANIFGNITLNGGTFTTGNGYSAQWESAALLGTVTVGGTAPSTINTNATNTLANGVALSASGTTFNVGVTGSTGADLTISAPLVNANGNGVGSLIKTGAGTMVLSGANTYTGGTTINAGTISIGNNSNLGANSAPVTLNGGTLRTTAGITNTHAFTIGSAGGTINVNTGGQYYFNTTNALTGNGALTLAGNGTLTQGVGNLRVDHTNSYSGALTVKQGGIFEYGVNGAVALGATLIIGNEGELAVQAGDWTTTSMPNAISVTGGTNSVLSFENGSSGTVAGPVALNADLTVGLRDWYNNAAAHSGTISGNISGAGGLKVNSGTGTGGVLTLSGSNSFTGNITIDNATLAAGTFNWGGTGAPNPSNLGDLAASNRTITVNNGGVLSLTGGNVLGTGASQNTLSGLTLVVNQGGVFQTGLQGSGKGWWNKIGNMVLNGGTVHVGSGDGNGVFQGLALIGNVTVGGTAASTIDNFAGSDSTTNGIHLGQNGNAGQMVTFDVAHVSGNTNPDLTVSARLLNTSANLTPSGLIKTGSGTMLLSANNSYTGATTINGGTLRVTGSIASSSGISVNSGGTLDGTGSVSAITLNAGGKVSPGAGSIGTLSGSSMTWNSDNTTSGGLYELGTTGSTGDLLALTGALTKGDGSKFLFDFTGGTIGQTYALISFGSTDFTSSDFGIGAESLAHGYAGVFSVDHSSVHFTYTSVPEPANLAVIGLGVAGLLRRRRRAADAV